MKEKQTTVRESQTLTQLFASKRKSVENEIKVVQTKCKKLGVPNVEFSFSEPYKKAKKEYHINGDYNDWDGLGYYDYTSYELIDLTVTYEPIKLDGEWELVAIHSSESDSIQQLNLDVELPDSFVHPTKHRNCDHCNRSQYRKTHFLVYSNETDKFSQVGSTCLKDFLGINPAHAIKQFNWMHTLTGFSFLDAEDIQYSRSSKKTREKFVNIGYKMDECISKVLELINETEFVKAEWEEVKSKVYSKIYYNWVRTNEGEATYDDLISYLEKPFGDRDVMLSKEVDEVLKFWKEKEVEMEKPNSFSDELPKNSFNSWVFETKGIMSTKMVLRSDLNKLCSAVNHYLKMKKKASENALNFSDSKYVGEIGERITQELTVIKMFAGDGFYGSYYIYTMQNDNGNCMVYKGSKQIGFEEDKLNMTFTIKSHDEYQGTKQTYIARPNIINQKAEA